MLPIITTGQIKDGNIGGGNYMIDLSEYMKKKDAATKTELQTLTSIVANKLDVEPQHKHHIDDIKQLETALTSKYDTSEKYSYSVILSDSEKIPYLEAPKVSLLEVAKDKDTAGYKFYVDDGSGDLMIVFNDVLIGTYVKATGNWVLGGVNLSEIGSDAAAIEELDSLVKANSVDIVVNDGKINSLTATLDEYIAKTDAVLKNHYDALLALCEKHGMVDSNTSDGDKITPVSDEGEPRARQSPE